MSAITPANPLKRKRNIMNRYLEEFMIEAFKQSMHADCSFAIATHANHTTLLCVNGMYFGKLEYRNEYVDRNYTIHAASMQHCYLISLKIRSNLPVRILEKCWFTTTFTIPNYYTSMAMLPPSGQFGIFSMGDVAETLKFEPDSNIRLIKKFSAIPIIYTKDAP